MKRLYVLFLTILFASLTVLSFAGCHGRTYLSTEIIEEELPTETNIYMRLYYYGETIDELVNDLYTGIQLDENGFVTRALEKIYSDDICVYTPDNMSEILGYYIDIVPRCNEDGNIDPKEEVDLVLSCLYSYDSKVYEIVCTTLEDSNSAHVTWIGDYEYERICGGVNVNFYGYVYNDKQYISLFSIQSDDEIIRYVPNTSMHIRKTAAASWIDILVTDEFFDSLTDDFFRIKKIRLSEYLSDSSNELVE